MLNLYNQEKFLKCGRTQEIVWIEELGELQHEITKSLRGMLSKTHLVEEFADVLICLEQLKIKYNISDEQLQEWIDYKYKRNCKRLEQKEKDKVTVSIEEFEKRARYLNRYIESGITIKNQKYDGLKEILSEEKNMMTKEEYKRELIRMWDSVREFHKGEPTCGGVVCDNRCPLYVKNELGNRICRSSADCFEVIKAVEKWSKEHQPKKLTRFEHDILKHLYDNTKHIYITRDEYNCVYLFDEEPKRSNGHWYGCGACSVSVFNELFQFVQWHDKEPTSIKDVLDNCEVMKDDTDKRQR